MDQLIESSIVTGMASQNSARRVYAQRQHEGRNQDNPQSRRTLNDVAPPLPLPPQDPAHSRATYEESAQCKKCDDALMSQTSQKIDRLIQNRCRVCNPV